MCPETLSALKGTGAMGEWTAVYSGLSVGAVVAEAILRGQATGPDRPHAMVGRQVVDGTGARRGGRGGGPGGRRNIIGLGQGA